jgi:Flp pilus assembly pilin Flp
MFLMMLHAHVKTADAHQPFEEGGARRRGATAMEYVFVISLIFVAAITGIGYLGQSLRQVSEKNGAAVEQATKSSLSGP